MHEMQKFLSGTELRSLVPDGSTSSLLRTATSLPENAGWGLGWAFEKLCKGWDKSQCVLYARHCPKCFLHIDSFDSHNNTSK